VCSNDATADLIFATKQNADFILALTFSKWMKCATQLAKCTLHYFQVPTLINGSR